MDRLRRGRLVTAADSSCAQPSPSEEPQAPGEALSPAPDGNARRQSGNQSEQLVAAVGDHAIFRLDVDGCISTWNAGAERLLGYAADEIVGKSLACFYPPETTPGGGPRAALGVAEAEGSIEEQVWRIRKDGSKFPASVVMTALHNRDQQLEGFLVVARDLTDRQKAEEALQESGERFRLMVECVSDYAILMLDPEGQVSTWNSGAERLLGYQPDEIMGQHISKFYMEEDVERGWPDEELRMAAAVGRFEDEGWRIRKDGSRFWANVIITAICDSENCLKGFAKVTRDLSERKHAEIELRRSHDMLEERVRQRTAELARTNAALRAEIDERERIEEALREQAEEVEKVMNVLPVAVWIARDPQCQAVTGNRAGYEMLRRPMGGNLSKSAPPEEQPTGFRVFHNGTELGPHELPLQRAAAQGIEIQDFEEDIVFDDGSRIYAYGSASPLRDIHGNVRGAVAAFMDVSELRRLDKELRQKVLELASADQRKDEFLAILAHELRNPLAPIRTGLEVMRMEPENLELIADVRATMERQTQQLVRLVDDLLDVSRITRGKLELRRAEVELAEVLQSAAEATRPFIVELEHELTVSLPETPICVHGDAARLSQVVANLLNNAAKYTPPGGKIELTAERQEDVVVVTVHDTGLGIPAEMSDRIFEMFAQIDQRLERGYSGLGIGLTLVKRLVEMHGGTVHVASQGVGQGSQFSIRLPVVPQSTATAEPASQNKPADAPRRAPFGRRILVVDDNKDAAISLAIALRLLGNDVHLAHDGLDAVQVARELQPDVVLMDIGMPKLNGYEAAAEIRKQPGGEDMILIAQTGWGQETDKQRTRDAGFDHHLVKPLEMHALQQLFDQN